ncbi:hypothetical protein A3A68_01165 [Candidatus Saccharibacteria bacterium RIFCSPLOWO2_01_FULL_48_13]|nr:MAG: hypothetical protein A2884_01110 [Candidatus Saccharibacteria bacterium RIFCSPHIGHO2_01_FULL_48_12]OGL36564.1 MAG: hypothetical protein A3A68_01165 [Candidatus Saccharibacteria bacterium RIFCSPLOWO2_01_FULL_48_13]
MKQRSLTLVPQAASKKRLIRIARRRQKNAKELTDQADQQIEKLLIRRFDRLVSVRRFIFIWVALFGLLFLATVVQIRGLSPHYQSLQPVPGGLYSEGLVGSFTNANPLYAVSSADSAVSKLVFSGLFRYDNNNKLVGDLAHTWQVSPDGKHYTVNLRQGISWHDNQPFTADDVVFTYQTIANVQALSYLYSSWQGITITKHDNQTVIFDLPNALASFPYALTNGIIPKHLLEEIPVSQLRSAQFNTEPVGTGPFKWKLVQVEGVSTTDRRQTVNLTAYDDYHLGRPKLDGFSIITFNDEKNMTQAFNDQTINAMSGLESVPSELINQVEVYATPLNAEVMTFFNMSRPIVSDVSVRRALVSGVNRAVLTTLSSHPGSLVHSPLIKGQLGFDPSIRQLPYNPDQANQLLDQAGWVKGPDGDRYKAGQPLVISLSTQDTPTYTATAKFLQSEWSKLGVRTDVRFYPSDELQSNVIAGHDYDTLLYGISVGVDPDVFAYWHSSQASISSQGRLNLSEYQSKAADQSLEAGRTRLDPALRATKYQAFLQSWVNDAPALALYRPNFIYISRNLVFNYQRQAANSGVDRFYNVHNWMIRQERQNLE